MKIRTDFVTNSSSASYIAIFAKIENKDKANKVIDNYSDYIHVVSINEVKNLLEHNYYWLSHDILGVDVRPSKSYIEEIEKNSPDTRFIWLEEYSGDNHPDEDEDYWPGWDPGIESHSQEFLNVVGDITEKNGFSDIDYQRGYGFDG